MYFSINWERDKCRIRNVIKVRVTVLDEQGNCKKFVKYYDEWIGVCTNDIDKVVDSIKRHFPGHKVLYREIGRAKKVLPYFEDRFARNKLDYKSKPFYKIYTNASHKNIGRFFNRYKIGYFDPDEWLVRIYIDLCTKYDTQSFYYKWYEILQQDSSSNRLLDSFRMIPDRRDIPDWTVAAFDIESVPLEGNDIPMGYLETDRIVMVSLFKWNERQGIRKWLLYVLPKGIAEPLEAGSEAKEEAFETESEMLTRFHTLLNDVQVITGYNINSFDFPCIFARSLWLGLKNVIRKYTSIKMGLDSVVTYDDKIVLDLYTYFKTFSGYDLPSYKLDDVAQVKLSGETKLQVKSTGIWSWYRKENLPSEIFTEQHDVEKCYEFLKPQTVSRPSEFGTFRTYLNYCLRDSELVHRLFDKEHVLSFLVERANFTALNASQVLHLGNSRYLMELFKTYGMRLGYFVNPKFFETGCNSSSNSSKYEEIFTGKTYQGALNFCYPQTVYKDVVVMDFASMYPSSLLNCNVCYGTCTIMSREEWLSKNIARHSRLKTIPYRQHSNADFTNTIATKNFSYPAFDPEQDKYAIVVDTQSEAFLPQIVRHFIEMRRHHQREWKETRDVYHYNVQLGIKILINSMYGVMANKESVLAYLPIAMTIVTLSRYQLLGSYHYLKNGGYEVCYADTDSLMVHKWPHENCDRVNAFLNLPHVELKYEQRMKQLIILSKKRYVYERSEDGAIVTKGFQKKINGLIKFMTEKILTSVWQAVLDEESSTPSRGWIVWVETVSEANYMCRDPKKYSIYRKIKNLHEYKSLSCASVKYLKKYPDKNQEHVEFTYSRADVATGEESNWVMNVEDCQWVNYEKLFIGQKKIFCMLLNLAFWKSPDSFKQADMVLNAMHWKKFVLAELLHYHATGGKRLALLMESGEQYTFTINNHLKKRRVAEEVIGEEYEKRIKSPSLGLRSDKNDIFDKLISNLDVFESKLVKRKRDDEEELEQTGNKKMKFLKDGALSYGKRKRDEKGEENQNKKFKFLEDYEIFSD